MARPTTRARLAGAGGRSNRRRPAPRVIPPRAAVSKPKVVAPQPKPNNVVSGPTFKGSPTIVRPDGVTEVLGPGGVVLEEIGVDGKLINDPIKDSGIDPKNPPASIQALRDEFREHVESGRDQSGEPFFVSNETKAALEADGLGDKGGAFTKDELIKRKVIKPNGELSDKYGQTANEKVVNPNEEQANLSPRDYVATIEEVIDSNRVRVSLSYNDGVNLYGHKGEDQVSQRFKGFRVNYVKKIK